MSKIGIIGFGNMGSCLAQRLSSEQNEIWVFDKDEGKTKQLSGIKLAENNKDLVKKVDVVIIAVKPQDFSQTLEEIKGAIKEKLLISIAAGISTGYIENALGEAKVIRTMPNMPARIGKGTTCLCKGKFAAEQDLDYSRELFENLGVALIISENMMDEATGVSGSGPGYVFDWIESRKIDIKNKFLLGRFVSEFTVLLTGAAVSIGFAPKEAEQLARNTVYGSIALLQESKLSASELKSQITSKGGTTEAALKVLHSGGDLNDAVNAAAQRAKELAKK